MSDNKEIYSKDVIEFVTVTAEFSKFLESASMFSKRDYISKLLKLLPLLYLKTSLINKPETLLDDEYLETFVSETEYEMLRQEIAAKIGTSDSYLEIYTQDMEVSDEANATNISEDLADIYQDIKNFLMRFQVGNEDVMNDALAELIENFRTYWGQRLVNCMRALHNAFYDPETDWEEDEDGKTADSDDDEEEEAGNERMSNKFLNFQKK